MSRSLLFCKAITNNWKPMWLPFCLCLNNLLYLIFTYFVKIPLCIFASAMMSLEATELIYCWLGMLQVFCSFYPTLHHDSPLGLPLLWLFYISCCSVNFQGNCKPSLLHQVKLFICAHSEMLFVCFSYIRKKEKKMLQLIIYPWCVHSTSWWRPDASRSSLKKNCCLSCSVSLNMDELKPVSP